MKPKPWPKLELMWLSPFWVSPLLGFIRATTATTLEEDTAKVQEPSDAAKSVIIDELVPCHGGPISKTDDDQFAP